MIKKKQFVYDQAFYTIFLTIQWLRYIVFNILFVRMCREIIFSSAIKIKVKVNTTNKKPKSSIK